MAHTIRRHPAMALQSRCCSGRKQECFKINSLEKWISCEQCGKSLIVHSETIYYNVKHLVIGFWFIRMETEQKHYENYFLAPKTDLLEPFKARI